MTQNLTFILEKIRRYKLLILYRGKGSYVLKKQENDAFETEIHFEHEF